MTDLIQKLFDPNPKTRLDLTGVKKHPWFLAELPSKNEYRKQLQNRLKKLSAKVRKEKEE